jgi:hypothetical protein
MLSVLGFAFRKLKENGVDKLKYLILAERTSAKFIKLYSQGKLPRSESILELMVCLEEALGGTADSFLRTVGVTQNCQN